MEEVEGEVPGEHLFPGVHILPRLHHVPTPRILEDVTIPSLVTSEAIPSSSMNGSPTLSRMALHYVRCSGRQPHRLPNSQAAQSWATRLYGMTLEVLANVAFPDQTGQDIQLAGLLLFFLPHL